jgi:hypothetical protein
VTIARAPAQSVRPTVAASVRVAAWLCMTAGVLGAASGLFLALVEPQVVVDRFSYPLSADDFTWVQVWFAVHHLGLLAGIVALRPAGVLPDSRPARWGWWAAALGMAGLAVTEVVAIAARDDMVDSSVAGVLGGLYGLDCVALGVGLTTVGASMWRSQAWEGWRRGVVLALGVWVFVPLFPALVVTPTDGARLAIGGWMLLFAALGVALLSPAALRGSGRPA